MSVEEILIQLAGTPDLQAVFVGYFWALFGLIFNIVDDKSSTNKKRLYKVGNIFDFIKYSMAIIVVMRFASFIINIEDMSFAGFIVGLSIINLPNLIKNIKNKYINTDNA